MIFWGSLLWLFYEKLGFEVFTDVVCGLVLQKVGAIHYKEHKHIYMLISVTFSSDLFFNITDRMINNMHEMLSCVPLFWLLQLG